MPESNLDRWAGEVVEQSKGSVGWGLGLTLIFHLVFQVTALFILAATVSGERALDLMFLPVILVGVSQLLYMIPAILVARHRGETQTLKGLIIGASLTFLLNAMCDGLIFFNRS